MYIFLFDTLSPGRGIAQACHITQMITQEIIHSFYKEIETPKYYIDYMIWSQEPIKIILQASRTELDELKMSPGARFFIDDNETTVVSFYPGSICFDNVQNYKLF
jgi:hypothetical protein